MEAPMPKGGNRDIPVTRSDETDMTVSNGCCCTVVERCVALLCFLNKNNTKKLIISSAMSVESW